MGFSRQEYWSGLPFSSPGDLPDPGIEPGSPALYADALPCEPPGKSCLPAKVVVKLEDSSQRRERFLSGGTVWLSDRKHWEGEGKRIVHTIGLQMFGSPT